MGYRRWPRKPLRLWRRNYNGRRRRKKRKRIRILLPRVSQVSVRYAQKRTRHLPGGLLAQLEAAYILMRVFFFLKKNFGGGGGGVSRQRRPRNAHMRMRPRNAVCVCARALDSVSKRVCGCFVRTHICPSIHATARAGSGGVGCVPFNRARESPQIHCHHPSVLAATECQRDGRP